jgi:hypothetical protein
MEHRLAVINGVDAATGTYLMPPLSTAQLSALARGETLDADHVGELRRRHRLATEATFGPRAGVDPKDLAQAGWGVVFAHDVDPSVREALAALLDHRRDQATAIDERRYREFAGPDGYRPGESKQEFLARHGAGPGPANPDVVPYYLLLVGSPTAIPFTFQYQLDVQYAVGRLDFDRPEAFAAYARSVVRAETEGVSRVRGITLFGPSNPDDPATELSATQLVAPLADELRARTPGTVVNAPILADDATKGRLIDLLIGRDLPAVLFTASHGVGFAADDPRQRDHQGALLCQEWPGPEVPAPITEAHYVCGADVPDDADLLGLVSFHFACFGAGTPELDDFAEGVDGRTRLAPRPFIAALPTRLLSHERGGALAVIGHVERAWGYSFAWPGAGAQTEVFTSFFVQLFAGHPVGSAFEYFNERYAELSTVLSQELEDIRFGKLPNDMVLAEAWTANNDARNAIIVGDPAVRIPESTVNSVEPHGP